MRNTLSMTASIITLGVGLVLGFGGSAQATSIEDVDFDDFKHSSQIYAGHASALIENSVGRLGL